MTRRYFDPGIEPPLEPPVYTVPECPVCGGETDRLLRDRWGDIVGCSECIEEVDAWEWTESRM